MKSRVKNVGTVALSKAPKWMRGFRFQFKLRQKFLLNTALMMILILAIGGTNAAIFLRIRNATQTMIQAEERVNLVKTLDYDIRSADDDGAVYLMTLSSPGNLARPHLADFNADAKRATTNLAALEKITTNKTDQGILQLFGSEYPQIVQQDGLIFQGAKADPANAQMEYTQTSTSDLVSGLEQFTNDQQRAINAVKGEVIRLIVSGITIDIIISILAVLVGLSTSLWLSRLVTRPILLMRKAANEIAQGHLNVDGLDLKMHDELGDLARALASMTEGLRALIIGIQGASDQVAASSEELSASAEETMRATDEISNSIQQVATGAESQMDEVNRTSAAIDAVTEEISRVAEVSRALSDDAGKTASKASDGATLMNSMDTQMETILQRANDAALSIDNLSIKSKDIEAIVQTIKSIAGQTNLLALNAAIEAARAGDQGRGFAVVADEVRKLANQSAQSAQEINHIIHDFATTTRASVQSMQEVRSEVEQGNKLAESTKETFAGIIESMDEVTTRIQALSSATDTISTKAKQVSSSVGLVISLAQTAATESQNVAASSEEQLASMEEIASTSQSLSGSAQELQSLILKFHL